MKKCKVVDKKFESKETNIEITLNIEENKIDQIIYYLICGRDYLIDAEKEKNKIALLQANHRFESAEEKLKDYVKKVNEDIFSVKIDGWKMGEEELKKRHLASFVLLFWFALYLTGMAFYLKDVKENREAEKNKQVKIILKEGKHE